MTRIKKEQATRCELAMVGKVVPINNNEEVQVMTEYICSAMSVEPPKEVFKNYINKYSDEDCVNNVKYIVTNTVEGMRQIAYLLDCGITDEEDENYYPAPFKEDYGSGYPCSFCYVYNADVEEFSELGDCFFQKKADGYYHRVS